MLFIIGFSFTDNPVGNWYQQFMPNLGGRSITDIFFLDSLTGWGVTNATNQNPDTTYVLKTTNGGDNWIIQYRKIQTGGGFPGYNRIYFINQNTGYTCGVVGIDKSTNGGTSWTNLNAPLEPYQDMNVLNTDTIWIVSIEPLGGGVFRTTNGGVSWQNQLNLGASNPDHIYMFNGRIGFISETNNYTRKTTDSGQSWFVVLSGGGAGFIDMYFSDSLTGWGAFSSMRKTTDGGLNWVPQVLPFGGNIQTSGMIEFSNVNADTIWGVGGIILSGGLKGMVYKTTDSGNNWLFQVPNPSPNIAQYVYCDFVNKYNGWVYPNVNRGMHTNTGGDSISYTSVQKISNEISKKFQLSQNYPNPFNISSKFKVLIASNVKRQTSDVKVKVYDITGKEVSIALDKKLAPGEYEITFDAKELPSGVYFYSLIVDGNLINTKKMILLK